MYLIYIDESGADFYDEGETYILSAIIINEDCWWDIDERIVGIKKKYFPHEYEKVELHAMEIIGKKGLFRKIPFKERLNILEEVAKCVEDYILRIVYVVIYKQKLYKKIDLNEWSHRFLFERLVWQMNDLNKGKDRAEFGIMIIDSKGKLDNHIRQIIRSNIREGTLYIKNQKFLIEDPIFTDSSWRSISQIADCVAYFIHANYRSKVYSNIYTRKTLKKCYSIIEKKLVGEERYNRKIFPK